MSNEIKEEKIVEIRIKASDVAKRLSEAFKGLGTDEEKVIYEITSITNNERQVVKQVYMSFYGKTLEEDISSELSGNFEKCALSLLIPSMDFEAKCLHSAMKGLGTNEKLLIQILCTKDSMEIKHLQEAYSRSKFSKILAILLFMILILQFSTETWTKQLKANKVVILDVF